MAVENKQIYIVMSQTGTVLSRFLKLVTRQAYNHASISLKEDLGEMYSFGRKNPYNPFWGGFVTESKDFGTFKRFYKTRVQVLALTVSAEKYQQIYDQLQQMLADPDRYHYNYWGLVFAAFHIPVTGTNRYYCSEFIRDLLKQYGIEGAERLSAVIHPNHFAALPGVQTVYCGLLQEFKV